MIQEQDSSNGRFTQLLEVGNDGGRGASAWALAKFSYRLSAEGLQPCDPEPLLHDFRDSELRPLIQPGTDLWPHKARTDVVVEGSAYAPGGLPASRMDVACSVGSHTKRIAVFGPRAVHWKDGRPQIQAAEPVTEVAMSRELAYGGLDWRSTRLVEGTEAEVLGQIQYDHPGMYPRNPHGRGYLVEAGEVPDFFMPQLERPDDLLTEGRLIVGDPSRWYDQPLPWFLGWAHPSAFQQLVYFGPGADAWYPGPQDESMPEVAQGFLPKKYRSIMELRQLSDGPDLRYRQGASYGMSFDDLAGAPISVSGMHPDLLSQSFEIPQNFPEFRFTLDGEETVVTPRLHSVVIRPADERVTLLFGAEAILPRLLIPGVHPEIPVAVQVDGAARHAYQAPPTMKNIIERGGSQ